jgi:Cu-Zn family superoxide dismutase
MRTAAALLAVAAASATLAQSPATRTIVLKDAKGGAAGSVVLTPAPKGVMIRVAASGLTPGWHAVHVHMTADCSDNAAGFKKSGGHTHGQDKSVHGLLNPNATDTGDLPNIWADAKGLAKAELFTTALTMDKLADADGSAVIVHAKPDDHLSQPIGGAGDRVACAVVKRA